MDKILAVISAALFVYISLCCLYLWVIAIAGIPLAKRPENSSLLNHFAIAIPAHDEETVIGFTVATINKLDYPKDHFDIYVVADFCSDYTARNALEAGAVCYERTTGERGGKGSALKWLFERIFTMGKGYDAIVVFDADTQVHRDFLQVMNARLNQGARVIQGQHIISNPHSGWFPALAWAMMAIDNRYNNQGRANFRLSANHMGDSICIQTEILREMGWGSGLTEDYELRLKMLLHGIKIDYEPNAIGYGQAPLNLKDAQAQQLRWARGFADAGKLYRKHLLRSGLQQLDWSKLDGVLRTFLPSYSTMALISIAMTLLHLIFSLNYIPVLVYAWGSLALLCFIYPLLGLAIIKAPSWSYVAILSGPFFMIWRTWIHIVARIAPHSKTWIRTPHNFDQTKDQPKNL